MRKINTAFYVWFMLIPAVLFFPLQNHGEVLKLKNGSWINGKILKKTEQAVIVDLGYDVLRIPAAEVSEITDELQIQTQTRQQDQTGEQKQKNTLYTASPLEKVSTVEGVQDFGESVVVVRS